MQPFHNFTIFLCNSLLKLAEKVHEYTLRLRCFGLRRQTLQCYIKDYIFSFVSKPCTQ